ncbi:DUF2271 domain-containing protein [Blastopirellula marina]|uniref:DUF2271 domain-containing protein n=1 Tax=Blastopirellula marina TaxID=124 RepID=A0A2S8F2I6_9BACT|nr:MULTISPECIES: DUF2271 domain-containing protein [Pirellulaceae]PQO26386.1 DUF2271 domain-containing protein [Blastopirellula marina]RCS44842.1 DUF2271 domain-containing protein [Bremerella cremea]
MLSKRPLILFVLSLSLLVLQPVYAAEMMVSVEIPRLKVSEYHRPYVAVWIQDENRKVAANLAVWYQMDSPGDEVGTKWLPDLRQWWRRTGRSLDLPVDGVSGATRPAGTHDLEFSKSDKQLSKLKPGKYTLIVEAAREVGGRELLEIPFNWPAEKPFQDEVRGKEELGKVSLTIQP